MVKYKLIKVDGGYYYYEIYAEGMMDEEHKGVLVFNPIAKDIKERIDPCDDSTYINHCLNDFRDENGNYKREGMVAWY